VIDEERSEPAADPYEAATISATLAITGSKSFECTDQAGIQACVDELLVSEWWRKRFAEMVVEVHCMAFGEPSAMGPAYVTALDDEGKRWTLQIRTDVQRGEDSRLGLVTLLHELAHCARPTDPPHGLPFVSTFLELLKQFEDGGVAHAVRTDLRDDGVPI
jgi:hypothetical protein